MYRFEAVWSDGFITMHGVVDGVRIRAFRADYENEWTVEVLDGPGAKRGQYLDTAITSALSTFRWFDANDQGTQK